MKEVAVIDRSKSWGIGFFFFQAEDGIRDRDVTGVQTCALPILLAYFRSQHDNQSWLASLTAILDTCSLVIVGVDGIDPFQARLTFAIGRHALVDLGQTLRTRPVTQVDTALEPKALAELRAWLAKAGLRIAEGPESDRRLGALRALYVPYAFRLSQRLLMPLAPPLPPAKTRYNWETSAWARTAPDDAH